MLRPLRRRLFAVTAAASVAILLPLVTRPDTVTLKSGGVVRGNLVASPAGKGAKHVAVRTQTGGTITIDSNAVRQVQPAAGSSSVPAPARPAPAKTPTAKSRLTPEQEAWMPRVRALVARLSSADPERALQARDELLALRDPEALPALTRHLAGSTIEDLRRLFVQIARTISGDRPVYFLVALSLYDPSPKVREEARKAVGASRGDFARPLYIEALKTHEPNLSARAALAVAEIGDPNGDAVPYLIDALVYRARDTVMTSPGGFFIRACPSCNESRAIALTYEVVKLPPSFATVITNNDSSPVRDSLEKITSQKFGNNRDHWYRWWTAEKKNRELQKTPDDAAAQGALKDLTTPGLTSGR